MTEAMKDRAAIKKELQEIVSTIRKNAKLKEFPKAGVTKTDMRKLEMEATIHCGFGEARSSQIAALVRHNAQFVDFIKTHNAAAAFETIKNPDAHVGNKGANAALTRRIQIRVKFAPEVATTEIDKEVVQGAAEGVLSEA